MSLEGLGLAVGIWIIRVSLGLDVSIGFEHGLCIVLAGILIDEWYVIVVPLFWEAPTSRWQQAWIDLRNDLLHVYSSKQLYCYIVECCDMKVRV